MSETADLADRVAETVRALNLATRPTDGIIDPADAARIVGALQAACERLPQTFRQVETWLAIHAPQMATTAPDTTGESVAAKACTLLLAAMPTVEDLGKLLARARVLTATLYLEDDSEG